MHWWSWIWFVALSFRFLFYHCFASVHTLSFYFLLTNPDYISIYNCTYTDIGCAPSSHGRRGPSSKHINGFENNNNSVIRPDWA
jgi:hypothetical protein